MNIDRDSPAFGAARPPAQCLGRRFWNSPVPRIEFRAGTRNLSALVSKDLVLDVIERAVVLILFLYFANRMLPSLADLISAELAYPELFLLAALTNLDA